MWGMDHPVKKLAKTFAGNATASPCCHLLAFRAAALAVIVLSFSASGFLAYHYLEAPISEADPPKGDAGAPTYAQRLFRTWPKDRKPDLVLALTGETYSYLQPCGCSHPQHGGLARRFNFLKDLIKDRQWPVVSLDLGDVAQSNGPQTLLKYTTMMQALHKMNYSDVSVGRNETAMPLIDALSNYALNNPSPKVLAANVIKPEENFPTMLHALDVIERPGVPRVGVIAAVDESVAKQVTDPKAKFEDVGKVLPGVLKQMAAKKPEVLVLLLQGSVEEAKQRAKQFPQFQVILCLSPESDPPDQPEKVGETLIVTVGHKGRYIGTVGFYRTGKAARPFDVLYQLVLLSPDFKTPAGQEATNPMHALLEDYARQVEAGNYLVQYPKSLHPIQVVFKGATYVGSAACKECHPREYKIWEESPHAKAYDTLTKATRPSLRQFDGECVKCHVTGFEYNSGYQDEKSTPKLLNNGCENCHGPGSLHVQGSLKGNQKRELLALMNPFKTKPNETEQERANRINRLDTSCQKCHDIDNDVHWNIKKWKEGKIEH